MDKPLYVDYYEYLHSPEWKAKRKQKLKEVGHKCEECGSAKNLKVHHITYENLGNEDMDDLLVVCKRCHNKLHIVDNGERFAKEQNKLKEKNKSKHTNKQKRKLMDKAIQKSVEESEKKEIEEELNKKEKSSTERKYPLIKKIISFILFIPLIFFFFCSIGYLIMGLIYLFSNILIGVLHFWLSAFSFSITKILYEIVVAFGNNEPIKKDIIFKYLKIIGILIAIIILLIVGSILFSLISAFFFH